MKCNNLSSTNKLIFQPVEAWATLDEYQEVEEAINNLSVVNNTAERGVKHGHDYLDTAR